MEQKYLDQFRSTVKEIAKELNNDIGMDKMFGNRTKKIRSVFQMMVAHMEDLGCDKTVEASLEQKLAVEQVSKDFLNVATFDKMTDQIRGLSEKYLTLVSNWNREIGKIQTVDLFVQSAMNQIKGYQTFVEASDSLRSLVKYVNTIQRFAPPAFQQSKHYLETLRDTKNEKV